MEPVIKYPVFCAWCGIQIGEATVPHSHGICEACLEKVMAEFDGPASGGGMKGENYGNNSES